jgi:hypothetical protein
MAKILLALFLVAALLSISPVVLAVEREMTKTAVASTGFARIGSGILLGFAMSASGGANATMSVYDTDTSLLVSEHLAEHTEAVQWDGETYMFPEGKEIPFDDGLYVILSNAECILYYKK